MMIFTTMPALPFSSLCRCNNSDISNKQTHICSPPSLKILLHTTMIKKNLKYLQTNENIVKTPKLGNAKTSSCKQKKNIEEKNSKTENVFTSSTPVIPQPSSEVEKLKRKVFLLGICLKSILLNMEGVFHWKVFLTNIGRVFLWTCFLKH